MAPLLAWPTRMVFPSALHVSPCVMETGRAGAAGGVATLLAWPSRMVLPSSLRVSPCLMETGRAGAAGGVAPYSHGLLAWFSLRPFVFPQL